MAGIVGVIGLVISAAAAGYSAYEQHVAPGPPKLPDAKPVIPNPLPVENVQQNQGAGAKRGAAAVGGAGTILTGPLGVPGDGAPKGPQSLLGL